MATARASSPIRRHGDQIQHRVKRRADRWQDIDSDGLTENQTAIGAGDIQAVIRLGTVVQTCASEIQCITDDAELISISSTKA